MNFKHYIITRNLYSPEYEFLNERVELIKKFTIPSLANQVCKNFVWLVTGDHGLIEDDFLGINYIVEKSFKKYIQNDSENYDYIITTRLDNDDYLLPNYIAEVQSVYFHSSTDLLIDLRGYRADTRYFDFYEDTSYLRMPSPFISLVEKVIPGSVLKTVYFDQHTLMKNHFKLISLDVVGWLQIIHDHNKLMNRPKSDVERRGNKITCPDFLKNVL